MGNMLEQIASAGELANTTADMRLIAYLFLFAFIITTFTTIIGYLTNIGGK